jgi:hypothetical protein
MASVETEVNGSMGSELRRKSWGQPSSGLVGTRQSLFLGKAKGGIGDSFDPVSVLTRRCKLSMSKTKAGVGRSLSSNPPDPVNSVSAKLAAMIDFMLWCGVVWFVVWLVVWFVLRESALSLVI